MASTTMLPNNIASWSTSPHSPPNPRSSIATIATASRKQPIPGGGKVPIDHPFVLGFRDGGWIQERCPDAGESTWPISSDRAWLAVPLSHRREVIGPEAGGADHGLIVAVEQRVDRQRRQRVPLFEDAVSLRPPGAVGRLAFKEPAGR